LKKTALAVFFFFLRHIEKIITIYMKKEKNVMKIYQEWLHKATKEKLLKFIEEEEKNEK